MANQYEADPRQADFLERYFDPTSKTYSNLFNSLVSAGYSESYAASFQKKERVWLQENARNITKDELVKKAKKNLGKLLDSENENIQADITKFVAKTDIEFSDKQETTIRVVQPILGGESRKDAIER